MDLSSSPDFTDFHLKISIQEKLQQFDAESSVFLKLEWVNVITI